MASSTPLHPSAALTSTSLGSRRAGPPRRSTYSMLAAAFGLLIYTGLWQFKAATTSHFPTSQQLEEVRGTTSGGGKYVHPRRR